ASMGIEAVRTVKAVARSAVLRASEAVASWLPDLARAYRKGWSAKAQRRRTTGRQLTLVSRRGLPYTIFPVSRHTSGILRTGTRGPVQSVAVSRLGVRLRGGWS